MSYPSEITPVNIKTRPSVTLKPDQVYAHLGHEVHLNDTQVLPPTARPIEVPYIRPDSTLVATATSSGLVISASQGGMYAPVAENQIRTEFKIFQTDAKGKPIPVTYPLDTPIMVRLPSRFPKTPYVAMRITSTSKKAGALNPQIQIEAYSPPAPDLPIPMKIVRGRTGSPVNDVFITGHQKIVADLPKSRQATRIRISTKNGKLLN